ncbi:MAG: DUF1622 domain-containing protein [Methanomicrobiales archaeon]|nr:DUF1622 domain-containing protein [Methanomicrobiales archaeon]
MFPEIVHGIAFFFGGAGALLIIYGGIRAILEILGRELLSRDMSYDAIRIPFTEKIIFGLEFFIAADIINTLIAPGQQEILVLGAVVLIRVALGYFLSREAREYRVPGDTDRG